MLNLVCIICEIGLMEFIQQNEVFNKNNDLL